MALSRWTLDVGKRLHGLGLDAFHRVFAQDALESPPRGSVGVAIAERLDGFALDRLVFLLPDDTDQGASAAGSSISPSVSTASCCAR